MKPCKELKRLSRETLMGNYRTAMGALITVTLIPLLIELPFSSLIDIETASTLQIVLYYAAEFFIQIISGTLMIGMITMYLSMARGQQFSRIQIFYCFKNKSDHFIFGYLIKLLMNLVCAAPGLAGYYLLRDYSKATNNIALICLGLLSLLLALIINTIYGLAFFVLIERQDLSAIKCFTQARILLKGSYGKFMGLFISFFGLEILGVISLGIGLLFVEPYKLLTFTNLYLQLAEPDSLSSDNVEEKNSFSASV